jgi:hypothetical protein
VVVSVVVVALGAGLVAALRWLPTLVHQPAGPEPAGIQVRFAQFNCQYLKPGRLWSVDDGDIKRDLRAALVLRRREPRAWMALLVKDYKGRTPIDEEVREEAVRRLGGYFNSESLEQESRSDGQLAGHRALRLVFRGEGDNQPMAGECYILVHQGLAYWLFTWAPAGRIEAAQEEFEDLRQRFTLVKEDRPGWAEERREPQEFAGRAAGYTLQDAEDVWKEQADTAAYGRDVDLVLRARESADRTSKILATVVVRVPREPAADVGEAAQEAGRHLLAEHKKLWPETTLEAITNRKQAGRTVPVGQASGRLIALHVHNTEKLQHYVLLAVVRAADGVVVVQCECAWQNRAVWEPKFGRLVGTFRLTTDQNRSGNGDATPK